MIDILGVVYDNNKKTHFPTGLKERQLTRNTSTIPWGNDNPLNAISRSHDPRIIKRFGAESSHDTGTGMISGEQPPLTHNPREI